MSVPRTFTDLSLDQLKIMFANRLSPRRLACAEEKYDLLKYLWKESQIEDCYLEKYKINHQDEVYRNGDAFSRHLLGSTNSRTYTGHNEYARQRLADRIEPMPVETGRHTVDRFADKKKKIHDLIRSEIGNKWWDFGRHLEIKQGHLDAINTEQNEVARKVDKVFEAFEKECCNDVSYVDKISDALINSRRTDLAKKVRQIMEQ